MKWAKKENHLISSINAREAFDRTQRKLGTARYSLDMIMNINLKLR